MQVCTEVKQRCAEALEQNEQALREAIPERENSLSPDMEKATAVARAAAAAWTCDLVRIRLPLLLLDACGFVLLPTSTPSHL
jgi:hypothetical protein